VLEHIRDPAQVHREIRRVLRTGGYCVHVVPTGAWRLWTNVAHYIEMIQRVVLALPALVPRGIGRAEYRRLLGNVLNLARIVKGYLIVPRHGEQGNALSEVVSFSSKRWRRELETQGFDILAAMPLGLFYTGHMVLGKGLSLHLRKQLARILGSACVLYRLSPSAHPATERPRAKNVPGAA